MNNEEVGIEPEEKITVEDIQGRIHKVDRWKYNDTLSLLARNAIFTKGTEKFYAWVDRFETALRAVQMDRLPLRTKIDKEKKETNICYNSDMDCLEEQQPHPFKRGITEDWVMQKHYEQFLDFLLDLATQAGFTLYLLEYEQKIGGGGVGFEDQIPVEEL